MRTIISILCVFFWGINCFLPLYGQESNATIVNPDSILFYSPDAQEQEIIDIDDPFESIEGSAPIDNSLITADYNVEDSGTFSNVSLFMRKKSELEQYEDKRIVLLVGENKEYVWMCSGAMVGKYAVLTAAHCLDKQAENSLITIYAGGYPSSLKAYSDKILYVSAIKKGMISIKADLGIIILDRPLGNKTGYFGATTSTLVIGDTIFSSGFPGSLSLQHPWLSIGKVIADYNIPKPTISIGSFLFTAYAEKGMSGGPIFEGKDSTRIIAVQSSVSTLSAIARGLGAIPAIIKKARQIEPSIKNVNDELFEEGSHPSYHFI